MVLERPEVLKILRKIISSPSAAFSQDKMASGKNEDQELGDMTGDQDPSSQRPGKQDCSDLEEVQVIGHKLEQGKSEQQTCDESSKSQPNHKEHLTGQQKEGHSPQKVKIISRAASDSELLLKEDDHSQAPLPVRSGSCVQAGVHGKGRKRVLSECAYDIANVIADPSQATGQPPGPLKWRLWLPTAFRIPCLVICLYVFVCSLDLLSTSFRLMAGRTAGTILRSSDLLTNPVVGLMLGVLFTVLVQSSSTCTSVIVTLVSSGVLDVESAIPMVMGANIGTSLTNTLVAFSQLTDRDQFEKAFSGATVHDCFNWLSVLVLLSFEVVTGYMFHLTSWLTANLADGERLDGDKQNLANINILSVITKPLTSKVVQIDKSILECWALGECDDERLLKVWCYPRKNMTADSQGLNQTEDIVTFQTLSTGHCDHLLGLTGLSDLWCGVILFLASMVALTSCLIFIVKLLHSLLQGTVAELAKKTINSEIKSCPWLGGYLAIVAGALLTILVQSSSVFTSTITPLVGMGLISVDRMYPLTLGSNVGTTTTAMLASLSAEPAMLRSSLQIALCHLSFNIHGILLFYPVPAMRWPLVMCKLLGKTTAKYRWFAIVYLITMFLIFPGIVLTLSLAGKAVFLSVLLPTIFTILAAILINLIQEKKPEVLPPFLQNWNFLPEWLHSLEPLDRIFARFNCCQQYSQIETNDTADGQDDDKPKNGLATIGNGQSSMVNGQATPANGQPASNGQQRSREEQGAQSAGGHPTSMRPSATTNNVQRCISLIGAKQGL